MYGWCARSMHMVGALTSASTMRTSPRQPMSANERLNVDEIAATWPFSCGSHWSRSLTTLRCECGVRCGVCVVSVSCGVACVWAVWCVYVCVCVLCVACGAHLVIQRLPTRPRPLKLHVSDELQQKWYIYRYI